MKKAILSYLLLLFVFTNLYSQDSIQSAKTDSANIQHATENLSISQQAVALYNNGDFRKVIELLETQRNGQKEKGLESSELYYNLGNAYFRVNDLAHARLNYERAALLDPGDRDIKHNINFLLTKIEDKIPTADTFFLSIWFNAIQNLSSTNTWAKTGIVSFLLFIGCLTLFFFTKNVNIKKAAFYCGIVLMIVVIFANIFSFRQKSKVEHRDTAIIMTGSAPILSSPDINSKEITILHAGTKVSITKEDRTWLEIEIDNGTVGWIQKDKLEII